MMLTSWREVIHPREDVMRGELTLSSFAADLGDAAVGRGGREYTNCAEFFAMTYLTDGLKRLLANALRRVSGHGGDAVIQVKTAFGGGKTHSMLALYHMMKSSWPVDEVLALSGVKAIPTVKLSVLAFNHRNPLRSDCVGGIGTHTLFGTMAAQLGGYEYVRENDAKRVSPGKDDFIRMFDELGPCVVLMDELVAYGRKLRGARELGEGMSYGNFLSFIQEVTEAATQSRNSLIVATLPESETEAGGDDGIEVLHAVEKFFGRVESVWKPVTANEGFEIVKKRLFRECEDFAARDETADAFAGMYRSNPSDFPAQTRERSYRQRLIDCYPFHPELFDRLYEDWSTLELFQRTRGVLRLLARVVRELCANGDRDAMIMPGSLPLSRSDVMEELTRPLPSHGVWDGIVSSDIEGENAASLRADMDNERFLQLSACRRNARTIMLGSAPLHDRGVERPSVLLGSVRPGDNIAAYNEALNTMKGMLSYLYTDGAGMRYWFDTTPNLQKTARSRANEVDAYLVEDEIRKRLVKLLRDSGRQFAGVHVWPDSSQNVPDDCDGLRLVVMKPEADEAGMLELLLTHGNNKRAHLNSVIFLCASLGGVQDLRRKMRMLLAWDSIEPERDKLNLGAQQLREVKENIARYDSDVDKAVMMSWREVYSPYSKYGERIDAICWDKAKLAGNDGIIASLVKCLVDGDLAIFRGRRYAPSKLLGCMDEHNLWRGKEELGVSELWNDFCSYCFLPKVASYEVLAGAIVEGVRDGEFGIAEGISEGGYVGLKLGESAMVARTCCVVRKEAASAQRDSGGKAVQEARVENLPTIENSPKGGQSEPPEVKVKEKPKVKYFYLNTKLDSVNMVKQVGAIQREVIDNLRAYGEVSIRLSVNLEVLRDIGGDVCSDVMANCEALNVESYSFEEEEA